jgi:hypothetical protein
MIRRLTLKIDVTAAAGLGHPAIIAATVHLPDPTNLAAPAVVCFAKPGGGYSRGYYVEDLPGPARGDQAHWHANHGWIFVSVDPLGVGDSSIHDGATLTFSVVTAANQSAEQQLLAKLHEGTLAPGFPAVENPVKIGIGQSMGACLTVVQQGWHHCYDGIGVLGYSAIHTHPPAAPGALPFVAPWIPRDSVLGPSRALLNQRDIDRAGARQGGAPSALGMAWGFHYDDVDPAVVANDLKRFDRGITDVDTLVATTAPPWGSLTFPTAVAVAALTPGVIASEAAAVRVPVLVAMGERDVIADPKGEPRAYLSADSVDLYICPRMGHMHNFAGTRELFWRRLETWSQWVREVAVSARG